MPLALSEKRIGGAGTKILSGKTLMKDQETVGQRVKKCRHERALSQKKLAQLAGLRQPSISSLESGENSTTRNIVFLANALHVNPDWLQTGRGNKYPTEVTAPKDDHRVISVCIRPSDRSCGGRATGRRGDDEYATKRSSAIIDGRLLDSQGVASATVFALIADGDAMANFIVHNDTVFFSPAPRQGRLESGQIYAFQTPNGPRIKRVHHRSDGQVILSCDHLDKTRHPDEVLSAEQTGKLDVLGEFIVRQG